jgi:hypothetical protein
MTSSQFVKSIRSRKDRAKGIKKKKIWMVKG